MSVGAWILPFVVNAAERAGPLSQAEEEAAVLSLADLGRAKGLAEERVTFVAREFYPLWVAPWTDRSLILDGMGALTRAFTRQSTPDPTWFIGRLRENWSNREVFAGVLRDGLSVFQTSREEKVDLGPLVLDATSARDTLTYLDYGQVTRDSPPTALPPRVTLESAVACADTLTKTITRISEDAEALGYAAGIIDQGVNLHLRKLEREVAVVKERYDREIEAARPSVEKRVQEINRRHEREIRKAESDLSREVEALRREREKLKAEVDRALRELDSCEKRRQTCYKRGDSRGERHWRERADGYRARIDALSSKIKDLERAASTQEGRRKTELERLRERLRADVTAEERRIRTLEVNRDSEVESRRGEVRELKSQLSTLTARIYALMEKGKTDRQRLELLSVPRKAEQSSLLLVPFYSLAYRGPTGERLRFLAPAVARSTSIIPKTPLGATAPLASRMEMILTPLSKELQYLFSTGLADLVKRDAWLRGAISEIGLKANLLTRRDASERLHLGLEQLSSEGWLSGAEVEALEAAVLGRR